MKRALPYVGLIVFGLLAPILLPDFRAQIAMLWVMVTFALTWDIIGGQMGYNSFGNIVFFGIGMYACAATQVGLFTDLAAYTAASGGQRLELTPQQFYIGLGAGLAAAAVLCTLIAGIFGRLMLGLRGHYFAIGTLGLGIAAGEIAGGWELIGAGSGMSAPQFPGDSNAANLFFGYAFFAIAIVTLFFLRWLYSTRFGLALNAIRDDEDKAEAMGLPTGRFKTFAWCIAAFFLALTGGVFGNFAGFIDPVDVAFAGATFGVWMVLMAILGGKGTLWGPVIGAFVFHVTQELFWTWLFGWQRVALGLLIVVIVVFFPQGIVGWARDKWPERFAKPEASQ